MRLGLCNLDCSWCDTPYTWDWSGQNGEPQDRDALVPMHPAEIVAQLIPMGVDRVVITGGEPMVQRAKLGPLVSLLASYNYEIEVETNGTLMPTHELLAGVGQWNVSPKLPHSGVPLERAWKPDVLNRLAQTGGAALKVVCRTADDVALVASLIGDLSLDYDSDEVWIMPEGMTAGALTVTIEDIVEATQQYGFNLTTRLHVLVWGNRRGV